MHTALVFGKETSRGLGKFAHISNASSFTVHCARNNTLKIIDFHDTIFFFLLLIQFCLCKASFFFFHM